MACDVSVEADVQAVVRAAEERFGPVDVFCANAGILVTGGIEEALGLAREAAGDRHVSICGGASTINQFLAAGYIDELRLHVAPVVLGAMDDLDCKANETFTGRVVRKDLVRRVKVGHNVPVHVLEFLLGKYCASDNPDIVAQGLVVVNQTLQDNFIRQDEAELAKRAEELRQG